MVRCTPHQFFHQMSFLPLTLTQCRVLECCFSLPVLYSLRGRYSLKLSTYGAKVSPRANQLYFLNHVLSAGNRNVTGSPFAKEGRLIKAVSPTNAGRVGM